VVIDGHKVSASGVELNANWLRERCLSPKTVQVETRQAHGQPHELQADLAITSASISKDQADAEILEVTFNDGHHSTFETEYLQKEVDDFERSGIQQRDIATPKPFLWDHVTGVDVLRVPYDKIKVHDVGTVLSLTERLFSHGHAVVTGVPCEDRHMIQFVKDLSLFECRDPVRPTNWGDVFNVQSKPDNQGGVVKKDLAYTSFALSPHVDNPYRDPNPGFQCLHVLENECSTGVSLAVDGFAVAEKLRAENPEHFKLLSTVDCRWENDGGDRMSALVTFAPWISACPQTDTVKQIRYSPKSGGYAPALKCSHKMSLLYAARRRFAEMLNDEANHVTFKLNKGDLWVFNNLRVLHGRTAFDPSEGRRHFQGTYFDMDSLQSAYFSAKYKLSGQA
jgi:gamma-butyrobetaine dioxygenase